MIAGAIVALLVWAARGRWPRFRRLALVPAGSLALALVSIAVALAPLLDERAVAA